MGGRYFDAVLRQAFLNADPFGLRFEISAADRLEEDSRMAWSVARSGYNQVVKAIIAGGDDELISAARNTGQRLAERSLERQEWLGWTEIVPEAEFLARGRRDRIEHSDLSLAFIAANLIFLHNHWLDTGTIDRERIARMFTQLMTVPVVQGVMGEHELLPLL